MPVTHVAIIGRDVAREILAGTKRVESRLSRCRRSPFGDVSAGDSLAFKLTGGPIIGVSVVSRVREYAGLRGRDIDRLRRRYNSLIAAPRSYWRERRACQYAVLIWFARFRPGGADLRVPRQYGGGWIVLAR